MRISIVIPSYNQATFLESTLRSVLDQDYPDKEVIVMDGGSADGSVEILQRHSARIAHWQSQRDGGQAQAIARGSDRATGELLGWLNSDDLLLPGALRRIADAARRHGSPDAVFYGGHTVVDGRGAVQEIVPATRLLPWSFSVLGPTMICQPGTFYGTRAYRKVGGVDPSIHYGMDLDLWLRFHTHGVPFRRVPGYLAAFRRHSEQKGHTLDWLRKAEEDEEVIRQRYSLARRGSPAARLARNAQRFHNTLTGALLVTLGYRVLVRHRWAEFHPSYSEFNAASAAAAARSSR